ncbi:MAG: FkbM family methyltransferase [Pseudomonadota bacterium]
MKPPDLGETTLILLDVEGHEYPALTGARRLLAAETKPIWMVEVSSTANLPLGVTNPHYTQTMQVFRDTGYNVLSTIGGVEELEWTQALRGMGNKGYENFVFCDPSDVARVTAAGPSS